MDFLFLNNIFLKGGDKMPIEDIKNAVKAALEDIIGERNKNEKYKVENGISYPNSAFLYVPDSNMPSTWKLRGSTRIA